MPIIVANKKFYKGPGKYIGRPSVLVNPFSHLPNIKDTILVSNRQAAVDRYLIWLRKEYGRYGAVHRELRGLCNHYETYGELTLICWCAPEACHGDVVKDAILKILGNK